MDVFSDERFLYIGCRLGLNFASYLGYLVVCSHPEPCQLRESRKCALLITLDIGECLPSRFEIKYVANEIAVKAKFPSGFLVQERFYVIFDIPITCKTAGLNS